jgi:hypothetical protein
MILKSLNIKDYGLKYSIKIILHHKIQYLITVYFYSDDFKN